MLYKDLGTDKTDNLTACEIIYDKTFAFQTITNHSFWTFYIGGEPVVYINKQKNTWVLGNTRLISRVEHDISYVTHIMFNTRNKSGISKHPCIILYLSIIYLLLLFCAIIENF